MAQGLMNVPGLRGYVGMQEHLAGQESQQVQQALGILGLQARLEEQAQTREMAPLRRGLLDAQLNDLKLKAAQAQRTDAFRQRLPEFMTPGAPAQEAVPVPPDEIGGGPGRQAIPAAPGRLDVPGLMQAGVAAGAIDPIAYAKELQTEQKPQFAPNNSPGYFQNGQWNPTPENRKPEASSPVAKLLAERDAIPQGDPRRQVYDQAITHATNPQQQRIIIPPQPRQLQLTTDAQGNQLIVNPDGTTRPLTTTDGQGVRKAVAADKPMTEFQGKSSLYGTRAAQSDKILKALEGDINTGGLYAGQKAGAFGNLFMSSEQRRVDQAQRDFVNAVLRQESGAVINPDEFANAKKQYFPQPGDDPETIEQKRANRSLAIQGFARMSGPKGSEEIKAIIDAPLLPSSPKAPAKVSSESDYNALPKGAEYIAPDGSTRRKK